MYNYKGWLYYQSPPISNSCDTCTGPSVEVSKRQVLSLLVLLYIHKDPACHTLTAAREPTAKTGTGTTEAVNEWPFPTRGIT